MNHATAPLEELEAVLTRERGLPDSEEAFLLACAKECRCCPNCGNPPCPGCTAGGICDESDCYCGDEHESEEEN